MNNTLEGYEKLKTKGYFDAIDREVFAILSRQDKPLDANQVYEMMSGVKYNLVQQAFTRLKKAGKIYKAGTHKGTTGFTRGVYAVGTQQVERQKELFYEEK